MTLEWRALPDRKSVWELWADDTIVATFVGGGDHRAACHWADGDRRFVFVYQDGLFKKSASMTEKPTNSVVATAAFGFLDNGTITRADGRTHVWRYVAPESFDRLWASGETRGETSGATDAIFRLVPHERPTVCVEFIAVETDDAALDPVLIGMGWFFCMVEACASNRKTLAGARLCRDTDTAAGRAKRPQFDDRTVSQHPLFDALWSSLWDL